MKNQFSSLSGKELVTAGHQFAKPLDADAPLIEIAKLFSEMASRLDCAIVRGDELQQKLDAVAAENATLRDVLEDIVEPQSSVLEREHRIRAENALKAQATDAYMNSVRAEGVAMFAEELGSPYGDYDNRDYETGFNRAIEVSKNKAIKFANQLRSGTHDTADKAGEA